MALWFIFVDHIPANQFAWATLRNYGLSDATEIFVFISGYTATLVYSQVFLDRGFGFAAAKVLHRCWTLYITYMFLFFAFTAQVAYTARVFDNPLFREEMGIASYFEDPTLALVHALILMFRPANLDVLPLYIVLLLAFPLALPGLVSRPRLVLAGSALLYLASRIFQWNLPTYPEGGVWYFNPFAWQFLFVLGGAVQRYRQTGGGLPSSRVLLAASILYLLVSLVLALSWRIAWLGALMPTLLGEFLYPISKTDLDPLRLLHFAALGLRRPLLCRTGRRMVARMDRPTDRRLRTAVPSGVPSWHYLIVHRADYPLTIQRLAAGTACDDRSGDWGDGGGRTDLDLVSEDRTAAPAEVAAAKDSGA